MCNSGTDWESNGNEEDGFTLFQEANQETKRVDAWNCIIDAIAYVSRGQS